MTRTVTHERAAPPGSEASFFLVTQMIGFLTWMLWVLLASVLLATRKTT